MSVAESRSSATLSILKNSSLIKTKIKNRQSTPNKVRFVLPHSQNVRNILIDFVRNENRKDYENLVCLIRDSQLLDEDIYMLLKEATECISLLNQDLRLFVEAILLIKWSDRNENLVSEYQSFLVNLLSAHNYHAKVVIDHLVSQFIPAPDEEEWPNSVPTDSDCIKCVNVHSVINLLLNIVPMCRELLMNSLINQYPYFKKSTHINEYFLHNLLWIMDYEPTLRYDILHLIFSKLILMDVNAPRELIEKSYAEDDDELFAMDDAKSVKTTASSVSSNNLPNTLDVCLHIVFNYFLTECHDANGELDWEKMKNLYHEMIKVFENIILPTYNTHHVQFAMFVLCSFKPTITEAFFNYLWKKVSDPSVAAILRQASVSYIASLLARANYVPTTMLKGSLQQLSSWIHSYISTQDGLECVNSDVRVHSVFYSVCQALFYLFTFRHKDLVGSKKNIVFLESLNFGKIVTSRLNPLRVCQPAVVQNFAAVTRKYQLAYCYSVIEHNSRNVMPTIYQDEKGSVTLSNNVLDDFYPFDPYILRRSGEKIYPYYRDYEETVDFTTVESEETKEETEAMEDDFLETTSPKSNSNLFSYGASPGFKFKG